MRVLPDRSFRCLTIRPHECYADAEPLPAMQVYPLGSNAGAYCTWTDTRDCVEDSEYTIWIY